MSTEPLPITPLRHSERVAFWFAIVITACGLAYFAGLAWLMASGQSGARLSNGAKDIVGGATFIVAQLVVGLVVSIHSGTQGRQRLFSSLAVTFTAMFATTVSINRFVQLTVVRTATLSGKTAGLERFDPYQRGSVMFALEVLGWGVFLSVALFCLMPVFCEHRGDRAIRWSLGAYGVISLIGVYGYASETRAFYAGFVAWGVVLYVGTALMAARYWRRGRA